MLLLLDLLLLFVLLLTLFLLVTAVGSLLVRTPFVPTPQRVVDRMVEFADLRGDEVIYDLGAGDGRFLISAKRKHPNVTAKGVEFVPTIWLVGKLRALLSRQPVELRLGDALKQDLSDADCIFLYLLPGLMDTLEEKFNGELKSGTKVVSYAFRFKGREPLKEEEAPWLQGSRKVRMYQW